MSSMAGRSLLATLVTVLAVTSSPAADPAAPHSSFHAGNPLVQRFQALYPTRVVVEPEDGELVTVVNQGTGFQVLAGEQGVPYLRIEADAAGVARLEELLADGWPADPLARVQVAAELACRSEPEYSNPHLDDPEVVGSGPRLDRATQHYVNMRSSIVQALRWLDRAATAETKARKIYFGLRAKLEFQALEDWRRTFRGHLLRELDQDAASGRSGLLPQGYWSAFVDAQGFFHAILQTRGAASILITEMTEVLQARLLEPDLDPTAAAVFQARLELVTAMLHITSLGCSD